MSHYLAVFNPTAALPVDHTPVGRVSHPVAPTMPSPVGTAEQLGLHPSVVHDLSPTRRSAPPPPPLGARGVQYNPDFQYARDAHLIAHRQSQLRQAARQYGRRVPEYYEDDQYEDDAYYSETERYSMSRGGYPPRRRDVERRGDYYGSSESRSLSQDRRRRDDFREDYREESVDSWAMPRGNSAATRRRREMHDERREEEYERPRVGGSRERYGRGNPSNRQDFRRDDDMDRERGWRN